jgi:DnaJ like chaperone protein
MLAAYELLGIPLGATREEITRAYRKLSQRCHPDKVAHLDEEFQQLAERKFRRLHEAYVAILDDLGAG